MPEQTRLPGLPGDWTYFITVRGPGDEEVRILPTGDGRWQVVAEIMGAARFTMHDAHRDAVQAAVGAIRKYHAWQQKQYELGAAQQAVIDGFGQADEPD